jgi:DNA-binding transcriptional MocR family regulator
MKLYQLALQKRITVAPGYMFSVRKQAYRNYIRLNYSYPWSKEIEQALAAVARLIPEASGNE